MPGVAKTMHEFKAGKLHSGSKTGPKVTNRKQAIAIALSEQRRATGKGRKPKKRSPAQSRMVSGGRY